MDFFLHFMLREFRKEDVETYFEWMQDEELLKLTGSEPMSKEDVEGLLVRSQSGDCIVRIIQVDDSPIGDIDLFASFEPNEYEINMMIARKDYRGRGFGKKTLSIFLKECLPGDCEKVWAKILKENVVSRRLFESFGFKFVQDNAFGEEEMVLKIN